MPLWRRGRVVRQRPAKPRTAVRVRSSPLVALLFLLAVAACGTSDEGGLDAQQLVPQLSDLPVGYDAVPAESFPVTLEDRARRPMVGGHQASDQARAALGLSGVVRQPHDPAHRVQRGVVPVDRGSGQGVSRSGCRPLHGLRFGIGWRAISGRAARSANSCLPIPPRRAARAPRHVALRTPCSRSAVPSVAISLTCQPCSSSPVLSSGGSRISAGRLGRRWQEREDLWARLCSAPGPRG